MSGTARPLRRGTTQVDLTSGHEATIHIAFRVTQVRGAHTRGVSDTRRAPVAPKTVCRGLGVSAGAHAAGSLDTSEKSPDASVRAVRS